MSGHAAVENAEITIKRRRRARRWIIGAAILLAVASVALFTLWQSRLALAERFIHDVLTARGISNASFHISAFGFQSIEVRDLTFAQTEGDGSTHAPDLSAKQISVSFKLGELLSGRVQSIDVDGLQVNARLGDQGVSLGSADPLLHLGGGASSSAALPVLQINDATVHLITPQGAFVVTGSGDVSQADASAPIMIALPALRLRDLASPARVTPMALAAHLAFDGKSLIFDADARTAPATGTGVALAKITGHYDVEAAAASAKVDGQVEFVPGKLTPKDISPLLNGMVSELRGQLAYQGALSLAAGKLSSSGKVSLSDIGFAAGSTTVAGVAGNLKFSSLLPPQTSGTQTLTVAHVETAVPLDNGVVKFAVGSGMTLHLVEAAWPFTGGYLTLTTPAHVTNRYKLTVDKIDIAKLLALIDLPGLSGTGTLSGTFPLKIVGGDPIIINGTIASSGNGVIIYNNEAADAAANTEQTELLAKALKDFHYTDLSGALDGNVNGNLKFQIGLRGANPSLYDGYPIHLNVNLQGSLADLIRRGTVGLRSLELIQSGVGRENEAKPK